MSFASAQFLAFFAVLFVLYYLIPRRHQWKLLLIGSVFFYFFAGWYCLVYIGDHLAGRPEDRRPPGPAGRLAP